MKKTVKKLKLISGEDVAVKLEEIPNWERSRFARATLHAVERFFELPGVKEDYEKWLIGYKKEQAEKGAAKTAAESTNGGTT